MMTKKKNIENIRKQNHFGIQNVSPKQGTAMGGFAIRAALVGSLGGQ